MASLSEFDSLAGSIPATKVEITVSCRNLLDKDMFSKSDPLCVMYTQGMENKQWREFGRTEVIDNTLNPDFVRKFIVDYFFEEKQNLRFDLYDVDSKSPDLSKHDFLGQAFCTLGEIVGSSGSRLEKPLTIGPFSLNSRTGKPMPAVSNGSGLWMESSRTTGPEASGGVPGKKCGTIILSAEELSNCRDVATMQFCANKLDKKDFFGKSDPFLVFFRSNEDGTFTICHKTEVMKNTLNPVWQTFSIPVRALCNGDYDRTIKVEVYDWDRDGSHDFIGEFTTSYRELARGQSQFNIYEMVTTTYRPYQMSRVKGVTPVVISGPQRHTESLRSLLCGALMRDKQVINPKKKMKKKKYVNWARCVTHTGTCMHRCPRLQCSPGGDTMYLGSALGSQAFPVHNRSTPSLCQSSSSSTWLVTLLSFAVESESTFLDYIKGGTQINFTVAIDFTASNGNPSQSTSLHYMSPYQLNAYALALTAVGEIIQHYDSDKMFPALGFGAKLPPDGRVSHEFPLNGNQENPSCCGIDGILEAYHSSLRTVQLYGPTLRARRHPRGQRNAAAVQDGSQYSVLLIITDGVISDMAQTKEAIVNFGETLGAAKLPMSIIIVGVGQAEFDAMVELDGDDVRISSRGKLAERDIVQPQMKGLGRCYSSRGVEMRNSAQRHKPTIPGVETGFVPFRDYVDRTGNHVLSMARLARDVLAEIPDQLVSYMKAQGIRPRPPPAAPAQSPPQSPAHSPPGSPLHTHI
ncbi:Copine-5 [Apodemus speciosus]|uniref:Copine-5 n=1 Tax=Apodemus speciosus TaxID=105296 RepID=A0ABQ0FNI1_APOSI